jgi:hypothetical protein
MKPEKTTETLDRIADALLERSLANDRLAARVLVRAAFKFADAVEQLRAERLETAREIARDMPAWPILTARHIAASENVEQLLKDLQLSENHPCSVLLVRKPKSKVPNLNNPFNSVAYEILEFLLQCRTGRYLHIPEVAEIAGSLKGELTPETFEHWWSIGWARFLHVTGQDPFRDERLRPRKNDCERVVLNDGNSVEAYVESKVKQSARVIWFRVRTDEIA